MKNDIPKIKKRYELIDSIRGFAVINMIAFHALYDIFQIFGDGTLFFNTSFSVWERCICISFILISGMCFNFSNHAVKNGIVVSMCGFLVTAVTVIAMPSQPIWFGILNLLGISMLICSALREFIRSIPAFIGIMASFVLFAVSYGIPKGYIGFFDVPIFEIPEAFYHFKYLSFLGLRSFDFVSYDYFPVIPWIFMYATGIFLWRIIKEKRWDKFFYFRIPILNAIGKHSLIIYIIHQPIIMLVIYGCFKLISCG